MRYTGPKNRIARREGMDLGLKTPGSKSHARLLKKLNVPPGQHGLKRKRRKPSEYSFQLREKQKLKYMFGVTEKQLKKYYRISKKKKGNSAFYLAQFLEKRLDTIVYRLGFVPTRGAARQLINHRNIKVNDKVVDIASYSVNINDIITFSDKKVLKIPYIEKALENKDVIMPEWLERKAIVGKLLSEPTSDEIDKQVNLRLIIEYYSK